MKCPKCGFVSFPGLSQCKKCGHIFPAEARPAPPRRPHLPDPAPGAAPGSSPGSEHPADPIIATDHSPPGPGVSAGLPLPLGHVPSAAAPWQEEVAARVQGFRGRRARLQGTEDEDQNLNLDFDLAEERMEREPSPALPEFPEGARPKGAGKTLEGMTHGGGASESPAALQDQPLVQGKPDDPKWAEPRPENEPLEIVLESSSPSEPANLAGEGPFSWPIAPLGSRFVAGLGDALILLLAGGLFALTFYIAHGRLTETPLNAAVFGLIAVFFFSIYFGIFTAFTYSTPGLLWRGLEVRRFDGRCPSATDSFWRTFGYLISTAAFMLGFIWAAVDSDHLTWHDRMSRTFIAQTSDIPAGEERPSRGRL